MPDTEPAAGPRTAPAGGAASGSLVTLLGVAGGPGFEGRMLGWEPGPTGGMESAAVSTEAAAVSFLDGQRVWAQMPVPEGGIRIVEMHAARGASAGQLDLTMIAVLVDEGRRRAPRIADREPATVSGVGTEVTGRTVDLSRTGARILLDEPVALRPGERLDLVLGADTARPLRTQARVSRVDPTSGEVAVEFVDISTDTSTRLDRKVLTRVAELDLGGTAF